ncbi:uncharacterized protein EV154DRAFT_517895 [Mucor mucedo]|uniref:uncharacterized protein n=1 Tax=Mucor mucedo TaxID=29922 RepID=UPI00221FC680|nr:uncharacterized protein EV154DRAFT_517895 [Mucor mucedo]KAI7888429.1 hypothetical protein EV154DRAFT_517895 [Mucor mucedo]
MEEVGSSRRDRRVQPNSIRVLREFARNKEMATPVPSSEHHRSRSSPKVTDHPWMHTSSPYTEFQSSPSSSTEMKSTAYNKNFGQTNHSDNYINNNNNNNNNNSSKYDWRMHSLMLCRHILRRGLLDGVGSDVSVYIPAWDKSYNLHRLVLDQNPYFKLLLQGGFREAESDGVTLHFEDNPFITLESFQFVLEYLYGKIDDPFITQDNVRQILATSSYFQLDVCGICIDYILKTLDHQNVVDYLLFADELMVQGSERICDAVFTFLCREAHGMDREVLASLPLDWLQRVIESDAFWVPSEFERYSFTQQIIQARYEAYLLAPSSFVLTELDTNPNCHILSRSIHYMHMTFEQLESIQDDVHPLTKQRLVAEKVLKEALWLQVKLRSKIESASEKDTKLNMTIPSTCVRSRRTSTVTSDKEEGYDDCNAEEEEIVEKRPLSGKYYPIPTDDTTTYTRESAIAMSSSSAAAATGGGGGGGGKKKSLKQQNTVPVEHFSIYPPFRFSVEFTNVNALKHDMRVYSHTVFYAGSDWNIYIQKTKSLRKGVLQLGVYLHRQSISHQVQSHQGHTCYYPDEIQQQNEGNTSAATSTAFRTNPTAESWSFSRYPDKRQVVKTWFKIYCPSRGPKHALTLFQSSPDNFSVTQSWGWRSTALCTDENSSSGTTTTTTTTDTTASSSPPPPMLYTPQTSNQLHYLTSTYDLRTIKTALNTAQPQKSDTNSGPSLKFTIVMGHV